MCAIYNEFHLLSTAMSVPTIRHIGKWYLDYTTPYTDNIDPTLI